MCRKGVIEMTAFGKRIRILASMMGKEEQDIASDLGLKKAQLSHYINGRRKVPSELLQKIVDTYEINPQFLFSDDAPLYKIAEPPAEYKPSTEYDYFPTAISAGLPINVDGITSAEKISLSDSVMGKWAGDNDIFITKICGDSMDKDMPDGSLIAVKPTPLENLKSGDMVVFRHNYDYSVKYFYNRDVELVFKPNSHNAEHDEQRYKPADDIEIIGKVVMHTVIHD